MHCLPENLRVVLVEPLGPINVGSVARLCENFGVQEICLVTPRCDVLSFEARQMALRGQVLLEKAQQFGSLLEAVADCSRVVATCGRIDHGSAIPLKSSEQSLQWLLNGIDTGPTALVFGREDRGLTNEELLIANQVLTLDISSDYCSLNLSHAVAIVLYELQRLSSPRQKVDSESLPSALANPLQLEAFLSDARDLLLDVGFLLEHTANARMVKIKSLIHRSAARPEEVALLRGVIRQIRWAINSPRS